MIWRRGYLRLLMLCLGMCCAGSVAAVSAVRVVSAFDSDALLGTWYELATLPQVFIQRDCVRNVRLTFIRVSPQLLEISRDCVLQNGTVEHSKARLRPKPGQQRPDWGRMQYSAIELGGEYRFWLTRDYWVIERDAQNRWLVIGQENRRGATVLAREPKISLVTLAEIIGRIKAQGYDACELMVTPHNGGLSVRSSLCEALNQGLAAQVDNR